MQSPPFLRFFVPTRSKYSPQHHILKHPQLPFLPQCQLQSFTPIQNNRKNYNFVYLNLLIFGYQPGRQKFLHRMIASISWPQSALNFFRNRIVEHLLGWLKLKDKPKRNWNCWWPSARNLPAFVSREWPETIKEKHQQSGSRDEI